MAWTIHGFQCKLLLFYVEYEQVFLIVLPMARLLPQLAVVNVGRYDFFKTTLPVFPLQTNKPTSIYLAKQGFFRKYIFVTISPKVHSVGHQLITYEVNNPFILKIMSFVCPFLTNYINRDASRPRQNFLKYFGGSKSHIYRPANL